MNGALSTAGNIPHLGEYLALASAVVWAVAVILFRISGKTVSPFALNLFKNAVALVLFLPLLLLLGKPLLPAAPAADYGLLLGSGFLGIAVSDTLFLMALNLLGASLLAIVDCVYSPFIIVLSYFFLGERLNPWQFSGVLLIAAAIAVMAWKGARENGTAPPARPLPGHRPGRPGHAHRRRRHRHDQADARPYRRLLGHGHEARRRDRRPRPLPALPPEAPDGPRAAPRPLAMEGPGPGLGVGLLPFAPLLGRRDEVHPGLRSPRSSTR